jgi:hypothetical protein
MRMLDVPLVNATSTKPGYFIAEHESKLKLLLLLLLLLLINYVLYYV